MTPTPDPSASALARLVETEDRLEAMLAERRAEAARLVEAAGSEAAGSLAALEGALAAEEARVRSEVEARSREAAEAAVRAGECRARRYRSVPEDLIVALAREVAGRVVDPGWDPA